MPRNGRNVAKNAITIRTTPTTPSSMARAEGAVPRPPPARVVVLEHGEIVAVVGVGEPPAPQPKNGCCCNAIHPTCQMEVRPAPPLEIASPMREPICGNAARRSPSAGTATSKPTIRRRENHSSTRQDHGSEDRFARERHDDAGHDDDQGDARKEDPRRFSGVQQRTAEMASGASSEFAKWFGSIARSATLIIRRPYSPPICGASCSR